MQTTYRKQTAYMILKTARVAPSRAGDWQVWVTVPRFGVSCLARLQTRATGWGDSASDVLHLENDCGETLTLTTSPRALSLLKELVAEAEAKGRAALGAQGHSI
jgi:hypothetical protein